MNNCLTSEDGRRIDLEVKLEWNEFVTGEIKALKTMQELGKETRIYIPTLIQDEIERRRIFLAALLTEI